MRWIICAVLCLSAAITNAAEMISKPVVSKPVSVTIYRSTALITREVVVPDGMGLMELIVAPLPPQIVTSSLFAEGIDGVRILSTRYRTRTVAEDTREEVRKIEAQIKALAMKQDTVQSEITVNEQNLALFTKLEAFTNATMAQLVDKGVLNSEAVIALATFIIDSRTKKAKEQVALKQQSSANTDQLTFLKEQLQEAAAGSSRTERDAVIVIDKVKADATKVKLNYLVDSTGWHPLYKCRAGGKDKDPVNVEYLASIQQQTGEDWNNIDVSLSTAQPMLNAAPPDLKMLEVGVTAPQPGGASAPADLKELNTRSKNLRSQSQQFYNSLRPDAGGKAVNDAAAIEQWRDLTNAREDINKEIAAMNDEGPSVTYHLKGQFSLPSRTDEQVIEIARMDLEPQFFYKAVPVLTPYVYRIATLVNKSDMVYLPGEATMYMNNDFVGRTPMPLVAIGKQFTLGFGVDPQIMVQRQLIDKTRLQQGGNQVVKFDYRISVNSYKTGPVDLQVWDRLPKADGSSIAVTLVSQKPELSGDALYMRDERPKNFLRWDVKVLAGQNAEKQLMIDYQYKIEMDKTVQIGAFQAR